MDPLGKLEKLLNKESTDKISNIFLESLTDVPIDEISNTFHLRFH